MPIDQPAPLTPVDCDCTDLDGFMLNVERLMASELVAVSSLEVVGAALLLWSRAWKQLPAASLPDDEKVIAAFCRLPLARFRKLRAEIMRGFVQCSDGRWYHRFLAAEAVRAFERKAAYRKRREADARRLRDWRVKQERNDDDTPDETRFVPEGQGRYDTVREEEQLETPSGGARARDSKSVMSENWQPTDATRASLRAEGYVDAEIDWQRMRFAKHFNGKRGDNWDGRFIDWVTREPVGKYANRAPRADATGSPDPWEKRVADYRADLDAKKPRPFWPMEWGFPPGDKHCPAPASILERHGFTKAAA